MPEPIQALEIAKWVLSHAVTAFSAGWGGHRLGAKTNSQRIADLESAVSLEKARTGAAVERITSEMAADRLQVQDLHAKNEKRFDRLEDRIDKSAEKTVDRIIQLIRERSAGR